jgi:SSS family solute:Na+ symporter
MAQNFYGAIVAWSSCFVATIIISLLTRRVKTDSELGGLVYSLTPRQGSGGVKWFASPAFLGSLVLLGAVVLNIIYW